MTGTAHFSRRRRGARYGAWHALDEVLIALAVDVTEERVAPLVPPADGIDRVNGRRVPGRIAVAEPTVIAVNRKTQLPWRTPIAGRPALDYLGEYGKVVFPR